MLPGERWELGLEERCDAREPCCAAPLRRIALSASDNDCQRSRPSEDNSYHCVVGIRVPDAERVATSLNKKFFPGSELESSPRLAESIDVKVVLGDDRGPQQPAEASKAHGLRL